MQRVVGRGRYTDQYLLHVQEAMTRAGIRVNRRSLLPNSRPSLEAAEFARDVGLFEPLHRDTLCRAYFEEAEDIGDESVLARLAGQCGLDATALTAALGDRRHEKLVDEKVRWAREQNLGGVPAFLFYARDPSGEENRFVLVGAQEYDVFKDLTERILRRAHLQTGLETGPRP